MFTILEEGKIQTYKQFSFVNSNREILVSIILVNIGLAIGKSEVLHN